MQIADFNYLLPEELIALCPQEPRSHSRLMRLEGGLSHHRFFEITDWINAEDVLVLNTSKVMRALFYGQKEHTGGKVEILVERLLDTKTALVHAKGKLRSGDVLCLSCGARLVVRDREPELILEALSDDWNALMASVGEVPYPPYLRKSPAFKGPPEASYQTVYANTLGSVAAPTAGLHWTPELLDTLRAKGTAVAHVTLHVGAGTFLPVREDIASHVMHSEWVEVGEEACRLIHERKSQGGRVIAVGTTSVRALETAAGGGHLEPYQGMTRLFLKPGDPFHVIDAMVTNFHLPKSTLLMLVSAWGGHARMMTAYQEAIRERYRFFSFGDAMWIAKT